MEWEESKEIQLPWTDEIVELYGKPLYESGNSKAPLAMMRMVPDGPNHPSADAMRKVGAYVKTLRPAEIVWGMNDPILGKDSRRCNKIFLMRR